MTDALISAENWGWRHAGRSNWAVRHLDLHVAAGERILLLGASGSGKSTLLHALAGLIGGAEEGEEEGRLLIEGRHPTRATGRAGLVLQDPEANVVLHRVGDDVAFGLENLGVPPDRIWPLVRRALSDVRLEVALQRPTSALSGGQKQRLALASALAMHYARSETGTVTDPPSLLLLDEPTANLDPIGVTQVRDSVDAALADRGTTLIVVEHRVSVWADLVDRVLVLGPDGWLADGAPSHVFGTQRQALLQAGIWVPDEPAPSSLVQPAVASAQPILSGHHLSVGHGEHVVLDDVQVELLEARSTAFTGPNGCGKTTLALSLAGLLAPLRGRVRASNDLLQPSSPMQSAPLGQSTNWWQARFGRGRQVDGTDPHTWRSVDLLTRIGTVFQQPEHQFLTSTVRDEVSVGLRALGRATPQISREVDHLLQRMHLEHLAAANPFTLSGGEKRRLSVATILATRPSVLVLDEPTFGQDRSTWLDMIALVAELIDEGHSVLSVSHDAEFIRAVAHHQIRVEEL